MILQLILIISKFHEITEVKPRLNYCRIHLQESGFSAYDKMWIHPCLRIYPHSIRKQLFSLADTVEIFYRVNCIGQAE